MNNHLSRFVLSLFLLLPTPLFCTTVVVLATQTGMVISTDSEAGVFKEGAWRSSEHHPKFVILHDRIVIAAVGMVAVGSGKNRFEFSSWASGLNFSVPNTANVEQVAEIVKKDTGLGFAAAGADAVAKDIASNKLNDKKCPVFAQFIVAGLQSGTWHIYKVQYDIDWREQRLSPASEEELESEWNPFGPEQPLLLTFGVVEAIQDYKNHDSYAYKRLSELCSNACTNAVALVEARSHRLLLPDAIALSRALIQVEKDTNPSLVGGEIRSVEILNTAEAKEVPEGAKPNPLR